MSKQDLIREFQKHYEKFWKVKLFDELGFKRRQCRNCGKFFWTLTEQEICNDASCKPYEFIGNPPTKKKLDYFETWKAIEKFFIENGHTSLKRHPVICRWFPLYFTIAGIVDFYRLTNSSLDFEFSANPTIINQICLRFNDTQNVGINSKSYTCFGMINQQTLWDGKQGYWKDRCIELDFNFLTKVLGIPADEIVFIEDAWLGPNAFGASLEYHVQGLELGNAVFTEFVGTLDNYREMKNKVIDMGAGWERLTWITQGTPTSYDCVFGPIIKKLKEVCGIEYDEKIFLNYARLSGRLNVDEVEDMISAKMKIANQLGVSLEDLEKNVEPMQAIYSIADHTRALLFALSDKGIISNVGGGYNLRVIFRRTLSFIDKFKWNLKLEDVISWHIDYLKKLFPELEESRDYIEKILKIEEERYRKTKEKIGKIVEVFIKENKVPNEDELITLYDSHGINPELLVEAGLKIEIPPKFYGKVTEMHMREKLKEEKLSFDVSSLPPTEILFYEKPEIFEFSAKVLKVFPDNWVVLDRTAFYAEAGGQVADKGYIEDAEVINVQKIGKVILHRLSKRIEEGKIVSCKVDKKRREILKRHHTATHIINAAARKVLGKHVFQHSAFKDVDKARLDITHFDALSEEEVEKIENLANEIVGKNLEVKTEILPRIEAEQKYGFEIYQGGLIPEKNLRIVSIGDIDHEACGGTHCSSTGEVGFIKIIRTKRIQDGIDRIEFCSGEVAINYLRERSKILEEVARKLEVEKKEVPKAIEDLFKKWKKLRKLLRKSLK
jgi:alanyl-tRNA synthetase